MSEGPLLMIVSHCWPQVQNHLAQANYYRDAANLDDYRKHAQFLPFINNEALDLTRSDKYSQKAPACARETEREREISSSWGLLVHEISCWPGQGPGKDLDGVLHVSGHACSSPKLPGRARSCSQIVTEAQENSTYKDNFKSLKKLVLVMAEEDTMAKPAKDSWCTQLVLRQLLAIALPGPPERENPGGSSRVPWPLLGESFGGVMR